MANDIGWGQGVINNIGWGIDNSGQIVNKFITENNDYLITENEENIIDENEQAGNGFGQICDVSWSGETLLTR